MSRIVCLAIVALVAACGVPPAPVTPEEPVADCPLILACDTASQVGVEIELDDTCYRCVETVSAPLPYAWTIVAPCGTPSGRGPNDG